MKVMLSSLLPNPFDKGSIQPDVVERLEESFLAVGADSIRLEGRMSKTAIGFWEADDGKHRIAAMKNAFDAKTTMVEFTDLKLTDAQMFQRHIHKNFARRTMTDADIKLLVQEAKQYLIATPSACKRQPSTTGMLSRGREQGCFAGQHGGTKCISAFLVIDGLSFQKVARLLKDDDEPAPTPAIISEPAAVLEGVSNQETSVASTGVSVQSKALDLIDNLLKEVAPEGSRRSKGEPAPKPKLTGDQLVQDRLEKVSQLVNGDIKSRLKEQRLVNEYLLGLKQLFEDVCSRLNG